MLIIPFVTATRDDPELHEMIKEYWADTLAQVKKLETGLGGVQHLFHEGSAGEGPEAAEVLEQGNPHGYPHLTRMIEAGAALEPTEDLECLKETLDLHRCMSVVQASRPVLEGLVAWFDEARKRRYAAIAERVGRHLAENGVGVLVISPDHEITFADNIEVIYVVPLCSTGSIDGCRSTRWSGRPKRTTRSPLSHHEKTTRRLNGQSSRRHFP